MTSTRVPGPAYRIRTRRLVVRCWHPRDAPLLKRAIGDSLVHLTPWMPCVKHEPEQLQAKIDRLRRWRGQFDLGRDFVYGIFSLNEERVLGSSGLHTRVGEGAREIGYWIHVAYINQGLATEAAAALTRVAFDVEVERVEIHCDPRNVLSAAVPRKLGFVLEATLRERAVDASGERRDTMIWTLLYRDYEASELKHAPLEAWDVAGRRIP